MPYFLQEYERELNLTADHLRNLEKIPIYEDVMKDGFKDFSDRISAYKSQEKSELYNVCRAVDTGYAAGQIGGVVGTMIGVGVAFFCIPFAPFVLNGGATFVGRVVGGVTGAVVGYSNADKDARN